MSCPIKLAHLRTAWFCRIFRNYLKKRHDFWKKKIVVHKKHVFWFLDVFYLKHFSNREEFSEILLKMYIGLHAKYPLFLSAFKQTWIFLNKFSENPPISNSVKIRLVGAELFHADRQTDRHDESKRVAFRQLRIHALKEALQISQRVIPFRLLIYNENSARK